MATIEDYPDGRKVKDAIQTDIKGDLQELNAEVQALSSGSGVLVSSGDSTVGYLDGKLVAGNGVTLTKGNAGGNETLTVRAEISLVANAAALGTGTTDGEMRITVDDGNRYTWDATNSKWRIVSGNIYSSDPSSVTYTIETGTFIYNTTDNEMKRYNGTSFVDYADYTGFYTAYASVVHSESSGTHGGSTSAATWNTRTLNAISSDEDGILSLSSNKVTPDAGTYDISGFSVAVDVGTNQASVYNDTTSEHIILGSSGYTSEPYNGFSISRFEDRVTLAASQEIMIKHYTESARVDMGLGRDAGSGQNNIFAKIIFRKLR